MGDYPPQVPVWKKIYNALSTLFCCFLTTGEHRPTSEILVNGKKVHGLFDTGAMCSCGSLDFFNSLPKKPRLIPYHNTLTAANGQEITSRGVARLTFKLKDYTFNHDVVILDKLKTNLIIGVDIMRRHGLVIDVAKRKIFRSPSTGSKTINEPGGIAKKDIILEPLQAMVMELSNPLDGPIGQQYLVNGPHVPQGITEKNKMGKSNILIVNKELVPIQIKRGDRLCYFEAVNESDVVHDRHIIDMIEKDIVVKGGGLHYDSSNTVNTNKVQLLPDKDIDAAITEVPTTYRNRFKSLIKSFSDIFSVDPNSIGCCDILKQKITLVDKNQVACTNPYRIAPNLIHIVENYVIQLLKQNVIENFKFHCFIGVLRTAEQDCWRKKCSHMWRHGTRQL